MADIRTVAETGSTNEDMKALARDGAPEGTWLRAARQTSGRGRMGRQWESDDGNLFASTLVRIGASDPPPATLALVAAVAVHDALSAFVGGARIRIKWPNDIVADEGKLCGMLLERAGDAVVIGVGVNVASAPDLSDRQAISLRALGAVGCDAAAVADVIADRLAEWIGRWRTYGLEPVMRAWEMRAHPGGTPLAVRLPDGEALQGAFEGLDDNGALILRLADGAWRAIHAGDVFEL